jgi:hypothetical protein
LKIEGLGHGVVVEDRDPLVIALLQANAFAVQKINRRPNLHPNATNLLKLREECPTQIWHTDTGNSSSRLAGAIQDN